MVDSANGNILKLNRYGAIRDSFHGTQRINYSEQKQFYRSTYVDWAIAITWLLIPRFPFPFAPCMPN